MKTRSTLSRHDLGVAQRHGAARGVASRPRDSSGFAAALLRIRRDFPPAWKVLLPAVIALLVHCGTLANEFTYDDEARITLLSSAGPSVSNLLHSGRGLTYAFHWLDHWLWGDWAPGFHLTNLILHAVVCMLVVLAISAISGSTRAAWWGGLVFAVHPVHVEAIASFANRKDILALGFCLAGLLAWHWIRRAFPRLCCACVAYALAMFSKEVAAVGLPVMLFVHDLVVRRGAQGSRSGPSWRRVLQVGIPMAAAAALAVYYFTHQRGLFQPGYFRQVSEGLLQSYPEFLANAADAVPRTIRLVVFPTILSADYPSFAHLGFVSARVLLGITEAVGLAVVALVMLRRHPVIGFGLAWFVVMYLPSSNIVPLSQYFGAERYLYGPSFGICLSAGIAIDRLLTWCSRPGRVLLSGLVYGVVLAIVLLGAYRSATRVQDWRNTRTLWESSLNAGIESYRIHYNLGLDLFQRNDLPGAVEHLGRATILAPNDYRSRRWFAACMLSMGRLTDAEVACAQVATIVQDDPICAFVGGELALSRGDVPLAMAGYRRAIALDGDHLGALLRLSRLLSTPEWGTPAAADSAVALARHALAVAGVNDEEMKVEAWRCLVRGCLRAGRASEAAAACDQALGTFPTDSELVALRRQAGGSAGRDR